MKSIDVLAGENCTTPAATIWSITVLETPEDAAPTIADTSSDSKSVTETVAVSVVVSEETGAISYAYEGQLTRAVTVEQLRAFLTSVVMRKASAQPGRRFLKGFFTPAAGDGRNGN